jgi:hypothetical protein
MILSSSEVSAVDEVAIQMTDDGDYIVPKDFFEELLAFVEQAERAALRIDKETDSSTSVAHPIFGSKHTYCCFVGPQDNECQQFSSYSWQAPLFCMRFARSKGYSQGRVRRGECPGSE